MFILLASCIPKKKFYGKYHNKTGSYGGYCILLVIDNSREIRDITKKDLVVWLITKIMAV